MLLIAHSGAVLAVNSSDGSDVGDALLVEDVVRLAMLDLSQV